MRFWPFYGFINMAEIPKNCIETKLFLDVFFLNLPHISGGTKWLILEVSFKEWKYRFCPFCASRNMAEIPKNCAEVDCTHLFLLSEIRRLILIILTLPITGRHKFSILTSKQQAEKQSPLRIINILYHSKKWNFERNLFRRVFLEFPLYSKSQKMADFG